MRRLFSALKLSFRQAGMPFGLSLALALLAAPLECAGAVTCAVCGRAPGLGFYFVEDQFTGEKKTVCEDCVEHLPRCFICGLPVQTSLAGPIQLADGRTICARDAATAVLREDYAAHLCWETRDAIEREFSRFLSLPETNVSFELVDRAKLQAALSLTLRDGACTNIFGCTRTRQKGQQVEHRISVLNGLPLDWFRATCAHEYGHAWIFENVPPARRAELSFPAQEGFCEMFAFLLMDSLHDEQTKTRILRNGYTEGQIHLFVEAERRCGINDILDWMKSGSEDRLSADDLGRFPSLANAPAASFAASRIVYCPAPAPVLARSLELKAIFWDKARPAALINDRRFNLMEEGTVRLASSNVVVRCLSIRPDAVRIHLVDSGEERELSFKTR